MQRNGITLPPSVVRPDKQDEYLHYLGAGDGSGPNINFAPLGEILDMESIYKDTSRNIAQVIEHELAEVRAAGDQSVLPPLDALAREMRFRDSLTTRKFNAFFVARDVAIQRFSHAQIETFFNGGRLPQVNRRGSGVSVRQAYSALFNAKLLVEGINLLNSQSATVKGMIAVVQAQEAERIAQEHARLAAEHAPGSLHRNRPASLKSMLDGWRKNWRGRPPPMNSGGSKKNRPAWPLRSSVGGRPSKRPIACLRSSNVAAVMAAFCAFRAMSATPNWYLRHPAVRLRSRTI